MSVEFSLRVIVVVVVLAAANASAQTTVPTDIAVTTAATPQPPRSGFDNGFFIQSPEGDYRLTFGLVLQTDGRFSTDTPAPITQTFALRKIRPTMAGRLSRYFEYKLTPDFGNGTAVVQDAYVDVRFARAFRVRTGKDKTPIGYELLQTDVYLLFPERSLASNLVPNRDVGVQVQGDIGAWLSYAGGLFNGVPDAANSTTDVDTNNAKDLAGRIVVQPFRTEYAQTVASGFGFQIAGSTGTQAGPLPSFRTSVNQTYFSYATGTVARGPRTRVSPAVFYYYRGVGTFAEYTRSTQRVTGLVSRDVSNEGWEISTSYVLTGEAASDHGVRPQRPFDPSVGRWGALQVVARYAALRVDSAAFSSGLAAPGSSRQAHQVTVGANWYPTSFIKYYATYERTTFDTGAPPARPVEHVILIRTQLGF